VSDEHFLREALQEAQEAADRGDYGVGTVIVRDESIISRAGNTVVTRGEVPLAHAEMNAFKAISDQYSIDEYKDMKLYTTVAPCPMCWGALLVAGVDEVIFGIDPCDAVATYDDSETICQDQAPSVRQLEHDEIRKACERVWQASRKNIRSV
jgi:tRNA(Arg) A34 adenosine deaminase TadA